MLNKTKMQYPNLITPFIIQTACINIHVSLKSFFFFFEKTIPRELLLSGSLFWNYGHFSK